MSLTEQVSKAQVKNILAKLKAGKTISRAEQAMVAAFEAGTLPELTLEHVAAHFEISRPGALKWKRAMAKAGLPWTTIEGIQKWRDTKTKEATPSDINAARKQKLEREVERLELIIKREKGEVICVETVREQGIRIASIWCSELDAMVSDLPGQVAGLSEAELQPRLKTRIETLKTKIRHQMEAL
jgi:hypothetical protein